MDYIKCPLCGDRVPVTRFGKEHSMAVYVCAMGGRLPGGKPKMDWSVKYSGYTALKKLLIPIIETVLFKLDILNGCDKWPDCLSCLISLDECPNEVARESQKTRMHNRGEEIKNLQLQGKSIAEITQAFGKSERTIRRSLKRKAVSI